MDAINQYLADDLAAAYEDIERLKSWVHRLDREVRIQEAIGYGLRQTIVEMQDDAELAETNLRFAEDRIAQVETYAKWLEPKVAMKQRRGKKAVPIPTRILRSHFQNGRTRMGMVHRGDPMTIYWSTDLVNWQEHVNLTGDEDVDITDE